MVDPLPDVDETVLNVDVDAALAVLAHGAPRNAIVACWMQLAGMVIYNGEDCRGVLLAEVMSCG